MTPTPVRPEGDQPAQSVPVVSTQPVVTPPPPPQATSNRLRIEPFSIAVFAVVFWVIPLCGLFFAQYVDIILVVFLAILLCTFLTPVVNLLERAHLHRGISILLVYLLFGGLVYLIGLLAVPLFIDETRKLTAALPSDLQHVSAFLKPFGIKLPTTSGGKGLSGLFTGAGNQATAVAGQAAGLIFSIGQLIVFLISILVMAFFLTVRRTFTADLVNALVPPDYRRRWVYILSHMGERMGGWVIGQVVVTIYYAVAFSVGLTLLHVPYAISVGVITGVLEIIPFVGGFIGLLLAVLVALSVNPFLVIWVVVLYLLVTNVEAHVLVPLVYGRAVHLHPFLVILSLLIGAKAFGLLGALIAVPLAAALQVVVENLYIKDVVEAAEKRPPPRVGWGRVSVDLSHLRRPRRQLRP